MKRPTKRTARRLAAVLAIITALATTGAWAGTFTWTGAVDNRWAETGNWNKTGNYGSRTLPTNDDMIFDGTGTCTDNEVVFDGAYVNAYRAYINGVGTSDAPLVFRATSEANGLQFGGGSDKHTYVANSSAAYLQLKSGTWSSGSRNFEIGSSAVGQVTLTDGAKLSVGMNLNFKHGRLILNNATVTVADTYNVNLGAISNDSVIELNAGGTLVTKRVHMYTNGGTVLFNGGTLKANAVDSNGLVGDNNQITVHVGEGGGTIDANNLAIAFPRSIAPSGANDGGMMFKGGGSVSLKYANTYTGSTRVELGTKIIATTADAKNSVLGNLVVTGGAADGDYYVFEYSGLTDEDFAGANITHSGAEGTTITRDGDQIKVHYVAPADDLGWNGGNAAWAAANAWTNATGTAKTWNDGNYAVFEDASTVTLGADASALSATFNADATIAAGGGTLTVPAVTVASGVTATINAPTAGALEKDGAGTLTLGSSRSGATTLSEGTLVMAPGATLATLTLGTDATKPVTFDYGGGTYATSCTLDNGLNVTLTNCTFTSLGRVANGTLTVAKDATASKAGWIVVGPGSERTDTTAILDINGGRVFNTTRNIGIADHGDLGSRAEVRVRNGGSFETTNGILVGSRGAATLTVDDGTVVAVHDILFCNGSEVVAGEDSAVNLNAGGVIEARSVTYGSGAANAIFTFNGGTLRANQDSTLI